MLFTYIKRPNIKRCSFPKIITYSSNVNPIQIKTTTDFALELDSLILKLCKIERANN